MQNCHWVIYMGNKIQRTTFLIVLAVFAVIMIVLKSLKWVLNDALSLFYFFYLIYIFFVSVIFISIFLFFSTKNKQGMIALLAVFIYILILLTPFDRYFESVRFSILKPKMEQTAIDIIKEHEQSQEEIDVIALPADLQHLSRGSGNILLLNDGKSGAVFFFTYDILFDSYAGYGFASDAYGKRLLTNYDDWYKIIPIDQHWSYYVCADH